MRICWAVRYRRIRLVLSCFVFLFLYVLLFMYKSTDGIKRHEKVLFKTDSDDISCYYKNEGDVLPPAEDLKLSANYKSIFFIDASCRGKLSMMQACVAESAALANFDWNIHLLFSFPITDSLSKIFLAELLTFPNVNASRINIAKYAKDTVFESILVKDIKKRKHPIEDTTNILKIVTLYKWGGISLDNDMLVMRSFNDLPKNWVVKKNTGILSFAKDDVGRNITGEIMNELAKTYDPKARYFNSLNAVINRVLKRLCPSVFTSKSGKCNGLRVLAEDLFNPIRIPTPLPFQADIAAEESVETDIPYTFQLKNMDYSSYQSSEEWPSEALARIYCPGIFELKSTVIGN